MLIESAKLVALVTKIFVELKVNHSDAREVSEHLVLANLKGHDSHGVGMVPTYVSNITRKKCNVNAKGKLILDKGAIMLFDADRGLGQIAGRAATDIAINRVRETGLVCMGIRNCHHLGRIGAYAERCGKEGYLAIHFVNVVGHDPLVAPFGGKESRLGTNPFCCVIPRKDGNDIILDMATSAIAHGKVRVAHMKGNTEVPEGALIDHLGKPTQNPSVMFEEPLGSMLPFGDHKGYGLALICELLAGGLAGKWTAAQKSQEEGGFNIINHMLMFVIDPSIFDENESFQTEVENMVEYLYSATPTQENSNVMLPGEPEINTLSSREIRGIPINENSWEALKQAAKDCGISDNEIQELLA